MDKNVSKIWAIGSPSENGHRCITVNLRWTSMREFRWGQPWVQQYFSILSMSQIMESRTHLSHSWCPIWRWFGTRIFKWRTEVSYHLYALINLSKCSILSTSDYTLGKVQKLHIFHFLKIRQCFIGFATGSNFLGILKVVSNFFLYTLMKKMISKCVQIFTFKTFFQTM